MRGSAVVSSRTPSLFRVLLVAALLFGASGHCTPRLEAQTAGTTTDETQTAGTAREGAQPAFSGVRIYVVPLLQVGPAPDLSAIGQDLTELLSQSLYTEFSDAGFEIVVGNPIPASEQTTAPGSIASAVVEAARAAEADFAAFGFAGFPSGRVTVNVRVYDTGSGALVSAAAGFGRSDLAVFNVTRRLFQDLRPGLTRAVNSGADAQVVDVAGDQPVSNPLLLSSPQEGMHVYLGENLRVGRVTDGTVRLPYLPFRPGDTVEVRKRKSGYYEDRERILVRSGDTEIPLRPMEPETRFATTLTYTTGQLMGLGVGVRGYLRPDWSFIAAETYGYAQSTNPGATPVAYHQDFRLLLGRYLAFPRTSVFRMGAQTGVGTSLTFFSSPDTETYRDTYLELFALWLEVNFTDVAFFLSSAARWSVGRENGLLEPGMLDAGDFGPFLTLGTLVKWQR
ncbi:MAG: hypothetical protein GVY14_13440 [Spirochaetes bacterium]|nr:hypothetical protein [Spirochaetota bacterium]